MPQAVVPIAAEAAVATTLTAAEIAAAQAAAAQLAAAELAAAQAVAATNSSVLSTIAATPVSSAAGATTAAGTGAGGAGGISSLVNTTGGPTTFEQVFSQGQEIAKNSTELGKLASTASELPAPLEAVTTPVTPPTVNPAMPPANYGYTGAPPPVAPPSPAPPPIEPLPINETFSGMPETVDPAGGFDTPGFDSVDYARAQGYSGPVNTSAMNTQFPGNNLPSLQNVQPMSYPQTMVNGVQPVSSVNSGIQTLAKEVGAEGVNTTLSGYGNAVSGPTGEMAMNATNQSILQSTGAMPPPAPPVGSGLGQLQTNLSSMGSNMPPVQGPPLYPRVVTPQVSPAPSAMNMVQPTPFEATPEYADAIKDIYDRIAPQTTVSGETVYPQTIGTGAPAPEAGGIKELFNQGLDYAKKNPLTTAMFANTAYNYLNPVKPYEKEKYKPTFKPGLYTGYQPVQPTPYQPQYAHGGLADLGGYSDGGRMLKGPGDGMSDDIPATIANKQPARLANEEFVIPADVVSHLGNGSSDAGAKQLYRMMDRIRKARTGTKKQGRQINPSKYMPA